MAHNPWRARMYLSGNTAITTDTAIPFNTVDYDPNGNLTTGVGAHYTVPVNGLYLITGSVQDSAGSAAFLAIIGKNTVTGVQFGSYATNSISTVTGILSLVAGDTITLIVEGANFTATGVSAATNIAICFLAPT